MSTTNDLDRLQKNYARIVKGVSKALRTEYWDEATAFTLGFEQEVRTMRELRQAARLIIQGSN